MKKNSEGRIEFTTEEYNYMVNKGISVEMIKCVEELIDGVIDFTVDVSEETLKKEFQSAVENVKIEAAYEEFAEAVRKIMKNGGGPMGILQTVSDEVTFLTQNRITIDYRVYDKEITG